MPLPPAPSTTLLPTRYRLQDKLGEGGMGIVYRATDRLTGETIALKQVRVPAEYLLFMSRPPETVSQNMQLALGANSKPWPPYATPTSSVFSTTALCSQRPNRSPSTP